MLEAQFEVLFLTHIILLLAWGTKLITKYNQDVRRLCGLGLFVSGEWVFLKMKLILSWGTYGEKVTSWVKPPVAKIHTTNTSVFSINFVATEGQWLLHSELSHEYFGKLGIQHWLSCANKFNLGVLQEQPGCCIGCQLGNDFCLVSLPQDS